ncbi:hypothetical protein [Desulfitobacterium sp. AusDCA]|uniref:hypothetical protein n=1 Tax=Desulfitobacterium sp. AusDCA TaxID=3240383 RepID=UPI003DA6D681
MTRSQLKISVMLILLLAFLLYGYLQTKLLTKTVFEVQKMTITSGDRTSEITAEKNKDLIIQIYESIDTTKTRTNLYPDASGEQTSEPYYKIKVNYSNGSSDNIYSTETGKFIYRRLFWTGWVGGKNEQLIKIIDNI